MVGAAPPQYTLFGRRMGGSLPTRVSGQWCCRSSSSERDRIAFFGSFVRWASGGPDDFRFFFQKNQIFEFLDFEAQKKNAVRSMADGFSLGAMDGKKRKQEAKDRRPRVPRRRRALRRRLQDRHEVSPRFIRIRFASRARTLKRSHARTGKMNSRYCVRMLDL